MATHRGDDLEDDFVLDEIVAYSDEEADSGLGDGEDVGHLLSADEGEAAVTSKAKDEKQLEKKRKRKEKLREKKVKRRKLEDESATSLPIAAQSPAAIAEYFANMQAKVFPKSTALELQDRSIPESSIADTTSWKGSRSLEDLEEFIMQAVPSLHTRLSQRTRSPGAPTMLFVVSAAMRGADATRALRSKKLRGEKGGDVAKLFAKHFKLEQQVAFLKKTKVGSAVGTPARLGKLLNDTDALSISALTHIVLDISHKDAKNFDVLEIPQTRDEVFKAVLGAPEVLRGIRAGKITVVLF
ncbi:unnamed protein product [Peniophora sp. CBMAI 1063]|nr:unnamed protein product [Peniophora sp. CBMAI 1063]